MFFHIFSWEKQQNLSFSRGCRQDGLLERLGRPGPWRTRCRGGAANGAGPGAAEGATAAERAGGSLGTLIHLWLIVINSGLMVINGG